MIRFLKYLVLNTVFASLLWFGLVEQVQGALNVGIFIVWVISILSLFFGMDDVVKSVAKSGFSSPYWFDVTFDLFIAGLLVWHDYYWAGSAYLVHMFMTCALRGSVEKLKNE